MQLSTLHGGRVFAAGELTAQSGILREDFRLDIMVTGGGVQGNYDAAVPQVRKIKHTSPLPLSRSSLLPRAISGKRFRSSIALR